MKTAKSTRQCIRTCTQDTCLTEFTSFARCATRRAHVRWGIRACCADEGGGVWSLLRAQRLALEEGALPHERGEQQQHALVAREQHRRPSQHAHVLLAKHLAREVLRQELQYVRVVDVLRLESVLKVLGRQPAQLLADAVATEVAVDEPELRPEVV
eukprot:1953869-Pleurochrysis_carterae.AAC.1